MLSNSSNMLFKQHINDKIQSKYSLITGHIMPAALLYKIVRQAEAFITHKSSINILKTVKND